jgi:hypothetical protein
MQTVVTSSESGRGVAPPPTAAPGEQETAMGWRVIPEPAHDRVTAVFEGHLDAEAGEASAAAFREAFTGSPLDVCWDVTHMTGFDGRARNAWAEVVWSTRGQINSLQVIGAKSIVRVGATFLALLLGKPYEFVDSDRPVS